MKQTESGNSAAAFAEDAAPFSGSSRKAREAAYAQSPKRAVNLRIQAALIDDAKALGINLSDVLQSALKTRVQNDLNEKFARDHAEALASFDRFFEEHGSLSEHFAAEFGDDPI